MVTIFGRVLRLGIQAFYLTYNIGCHQITLQGDIIGGVNVIYPKFSSVYSVMHNHADKI